MSVTTKAPLIISIMVLDGGVSIKIPKSYNQDDIGKVLLRHSIDDAVKTIRDLMMDCRDANNLSI